MNELIDKINLEMINFGSKFGYKFCTIPLNRRDNRGKVEEFYFAIVEANNIFSDVKFRDLIFKDYEEVFKVHQNTQDMIANNVGVLMTVVEDSFKVNFDLLSLYCKGVTREHISLVLRDMEEHNLELLSNVK